MRPGDRVWWADDAGVWHLGRLLAVGDCLGRQLCQVQLESIACCVVEWIEDLRPAEPLGLVHSTEGQGRPALQRVGVQGSPLQELGEAGVSAGGMFGQLRPRWSVAWKATPPLPEPICLSFRLPESPN